MRCLPPLGALRKVACPLDRASVSERPADDWSRTAPDPILTQLHRHET